jgi:hypothetical protein
MASHHDNRYGQTTFAKQLRQPVPGKRPGRMLGTTDRERDLHTLTREYRRKIHTIFADMKPRQGGNRAFDYS